MPPRVLASGPKPCGGNNNNDKAINGVAGHNTPIIKSSMIEGKISHKAVVNILN